MTGYSRPVRAFRTPIVPISALRIWWILRARSRPLSLNVTSPLLLIEVTLLLMTWISLIDLRVVSGFCLEISPLRVERVFS